MIYCPVCHGAGKLFNGSEGDVVYRVCERFGLVKKQKSGLGEGVRT